MSSENNIPRTNTRARWWRYFLKSLAVGVGLFAVRDLVPRIYKPLRSCYSVTLHPTGNPNACSDSRCYTGSHPSTSTPVRVRHFRTPIPPFLFQSACTLRRTVIGALVSASVLYIAKSRDTHPPITPFVIQFVFTVSAVCRVSFLHDVALN
jgi:hypothetical protein